MSRRASCEDRILTIPNVLSLIRIAMIPFMVMLYMKEEFEWTAVLIVLSGISDMVDGYVARRFHMVSKFGKALDPIADKLTQWIVLICLVIRFRLMLVPVCLMLIKELTNLILTWLTYRKNGEVHGADWHGKVNTWLLYMMIFLHVIWGDIPELISDVTILICTAMMMYSFVVYTIRNARYYKASRVNH